MKKITTLFKKDPKNLGRVINEIHPDNKWVFDEGVIASRKFDGTACAIIDGKLYKRYDAKINRKTGKKKPIPEGAIECQEADPVSGHHPHWVLCDRNNPEDKYHWEAFDPMLTGNTDGTYELCGPKINGNAEQMPSHLLIRHGDWQTPMYTDYLYLKEYLMYKDIEGVVYRHPDGRMCKIRKSDFGIKR